LLTAVLRKFSNQHQKTEDLQDYIGPYFVKFEAFGNKRLIDENLDFIRHRFVKQLQILKKSQ